MPAGLVRPLGFSSTGVVLADALARLGIKADFIQISPYKSAADPLTKSEMSPEVREQVTWLLDSNHKELVSAVAESRRVEPDAAAELVDASPYTDAAALEKHVVDGLLPEEELPNRLGGRDARARIATWDQARRRVRAPRPATGRGRYVAIMRVEGTMTGSIGVLTGKLVTGGLFSKLLVNRETVAFGQHVTLEGDDDPFTDEERKIVEGEIDRVYELFLEAVGSSRKMTRDEVHPIAAGRVWTGSQALQRKLVDELGGLDAAVRKARSLAGLADGVPAREVRAPRRPVPPQAMPSAAAWIGYVLEGVGLLGRAPALAVMEFLPSDPECAGCRG